MNRTVREPTSPDAAQHPSPTRDVRTFSYYDALAYVRPSRTSTSYDALNRLTTQTDAYGTSV